MVGVVSGGGPRAKRAVCLSDMVAGERLNI
jgi:hypothetical protein